MTVKDFAQNFTRFSGIHGIHTSYLIVPQNKHLRRFCALTFVVCFIGYCTQLGLLIKQYSKREVSTTVEMQFKPLIFPSVTICNLNPYKKTSVFNSRQLTELMSGYNFVSQMQSLNAAKKRRKKEQTVEDECATSPQESQYANGVENFYYSCPASTQNDDHFCITGCGAEEMYLCAPLSTVSCSDQPLLDAFHDVDRVFRQCVESDLCSNHSFCTQDIANATQCEPVLGQCATEGQAAGLCMDTISHVCAIITQFCAAESELCIDGIGPASVLTTVQPMTPPTTAAPEKNRYAPKVPPPPPGVLPPRPPPNPPAPPGWPPASSDPWVPPPPPPNPFADPSLPPPPPLDFSLVGLLSSDSPDAKALVAQLANVAGDLDIDPTTSTGKVFVDVQMQMIEVASEMTSAERGRLGYSREELLSSCSFDGVPCNLTSDFALWEDSDYGNCYTYNWNSKIISQRPGNTYGLTMTIMTNISEYLFSTQQSGARVTVHPPGTVPFPAINGYSVSAGSSTSFKVRYNEFERQPPPFGNCTETNDPDKYYFEGNYTYEGCSRSCFQDYVINKCACGDSRFPLPPQDKARRRAPVYKSCRRTNVTETACLNDILDNDVEKSMQNCECHLPCRQQAYTIQPGISVWPSNPNFVAGLCFPSVLKKANLTCMQLYKRNALTIEVFYDYFNYEVIIEQPVMTTGTLWNQASGALGLWTSMSMITVVEIITAIIQLVAFIFGTNKLMPHPIPDADRQPQKSSDVKEFAYNSANQTNDLLPPVPSYYN